MAEKIRLWNRLLWGALASLLSGLLAFFGLTRSGEARQPNDGAFKPGVSMEIPRPRVFNFHWPLLQNDTDRDFLSDEEESLLHIGPIHFNPHVWDMNQNGLPDGPDLAWGFALRIAQLPEWQPGDPEPNEIYKIDYAMDGIENCTVCGKPVDMGYYEIVNPFNEVRETVFKVALHFMERGSFSYNGSLHQGRLNVPRLKEILLEDPHQEPVIGDSDEDLLANHEEVEIGYDPRNPDEDGNFHLDGPHLGEELFVCIEGLPQGPLEDQVYRIEHYAYGNETCGVCGEAINMGFVEIVNPMNSLRIEIPYIGLHGLKHGTFDYRGDVNSGRILLPLLLQVLGYNESG